MRGRPGRAGRWIDQEAAITHILSGLLPAAGRSFGSAAHQAFVQPGALPVPPTVEVPNPLDGVGSLMGGQLITAVTDLLRAFAQDFLSQLAAPVATYVLRTPDVLGEPSLRRSG